MPTRSGAYRRIHRWQLWLAAGAVAAAVPGLLLGVDSYAAPVFLLTAVWIPVPLFLTRNTPAFGWACRVIGLGLVAWSVLGVLLAMFVFLPSSVLLLLAAGADPRRRPVVARVLGSVGGLVLAGVVAGTAVWCHDVSAGQARAEPHAYRAAMPSGSPTPTGNPMLADISVLPDNVTLPATPSPPFGGHLSDVQDRLRALGATSVWISGTGGEEISYLVVRFPGELAEPRRAALRAQVAGLPGVSGVELCPVRECG